MNNENCFSQIKINNNIIRKIDFIYNLVNEKFILLNI